MQDIHVISYNYNIYRCSVNIYGSLYFICYRIKAISTGSIPELNCILSRTKSCDVSIIDMLFDLEFKTYNLSCSWLKTRLVGFFSTPITPTTLFSNLSTTDT